MSARDTTRPAAQLLVVAKAPVPGRVKTRLCPPCTPQQAAELAAAALADTLAACDAVPGVRRTLLLDGALTAPPGWRTVPQRGVGLAERLANGFADTRLADVPSLLIGMDTPQVGAGRLLAALAALAGADAALGSAEDGGWWALGLREPRHAAVLAGVPMSAPDTCARTRAALRGLGLRVAPLPRLRDVDTARDARLVAAQCPPGSRFAAAVPDLVPA